jgi:uncharacterized protein (DUF4415 family)
MSKMPRSKRIIRTPGQLPRGKAVAAPFDDNPEWTEADFENAQKASQLHGPEISAALTRRRGRPRKEERDRKEAISIRLSPDVLAHFRAFGSGWQTLIDELLRGYVRSFGEAEGVFLMVTDARGSALSLTPIGKVAGRLSDEAQLRAPFGMPIVANAEDEMLGAIRNKA